MKRYLLPTLLAFVAALLGVVLGRYLLPERPRTGIDLHQVLHKDIRLDAKQQARIEKIERAFAVRRQALETQLRADNASLAYAIAAEHRNGPRVNAAIDHSHHVMGELQKETLSHVFAMRGVLHPDQTAVFDKAVVKALTDDAR